MSCNGFIEEYRLDRDYPPNNRCPTTLAELKSTLREWIRQYNEQFAGRNGRVPLAPGDARARLYSTTTVETQKEESGVVLKQHGPAPNYADGVCSVSACKRGMRTSNVFQSNFKSSETPGVLIPTQPIFVAPFSSGNEGAQYAASIGLITHGFNSMHHYKQHLYEQRQELVPNRVADENDANSFGGRFGDAYTGRPKSQHGHHESEYKKYITENHYPVLCDKGFSVTWGEPSFAREYHFQNNKKITAGTDFNQFFDALVQSDKGMLFQEISQGV